MADSEAMRPVGFRWLGSRTQVVLGLILGAGTLYLAVRGLDFEQLGEALRSIRIEFVLLTLLIFLLTQAVKAVRWRHLLAPAQNGRRLSLGRLAGLLLIGQAANLLLPTRLGDLLRAYLAGEEAGASKVYMLGTLAAEKLLDLAALALLAVALLPFMVLPSWLAGRVVPLVVAALALAAGIAGLSGGRRLWLPVANRLLQVLPPALAAVWRSRLAAGLDGLAALTTRSAALSVWCWTLVVWALALVTNLALFLAFGLPASMLPALFLLVVMQAGIAVPLPSAPGKIGIFHYLCMLALSVFNITGPVALGYALVLHLVVVGATSTWAALALWQRSWQARSDQGLRLRDS